MRKVARLVLFWTGLLWAGSASTPLDSLHGNVHLRKNASPYLVSKSLSQGPSDSLFMEPGVVVLVAGYVRLDFSGAVRIDGSVAKPVRFSTQDSTADWMGLVFKGTKPIHISGLLVENAFRNSLEGVSGVLEGSRFKNGYTGLWVERVQNLQVEDCEFSGNRFGIYLAEGVLEMSQVRVQGNVTGIWLEPGTSVSGAKNIISGNQVVDQSTPRSPSRQTAQGRYPQSILQSVESGF